VPATVVGAAARLALTHIQHSTMVIKGFIEGLRRRPAERDSA
jgi:hypothetical protein